MSEDNLLNRLRQNRQRSNVPKRDDPLISEEQKTRPQPTPANSEPKQDSESDNILLNLQAELAEFPETKRHSAIVLEKKLDIELTRYCKDLGITVETFLEAAWIIAGAKPKLLKQITDEAQTRYKSRKEAGRLRRLITMLSKNV